MDMSTPMGQGPKMKLVMVGNGMAGVRTLEELLKLAPDLYDITVFGAEPHPNYNRILLSPVLAGEQTVDDIVLNPLDWYNENNITLHTGQESGEDRPHRACVEADDGTRADYDRLLLATGSNPFILPVPGADLPGVISFRDIADVDAMIHASSQYRHAVVIGGGLLGLEAANGLMKRGMDVTVVHIGPWLMERQLDEPAARLLQKSLEEKGMKFLLQKQTAALVSGGCSDSSPSGEGGRGRDQVQGRRLGPRRSGGDGGRHPPQHRTRRIGRPALQPRHRGERHDADLRPAHLFHW
jgi:nitrite reductase (NADH) large subunit